MKTKKSYCTQNDGHCPTCSLVSYGRDCMNNKINYEEFKNEKESDEA